MSFITDFINFLCRPAILFTLSCGAFYLVLFPFREKFAKKSALYWIMGLMSAFILVSMLNSTFRDVVTKPDNVPIVLMLFLLVFFCWLPLHKAVKNDRLIEEGKDVENKQEARELVFTWPDLIFSEFICSIVAWAVLLIWAILIRAPLEEPANPVETPNPSKAPWYFLGLQEMLVYFDPWLAGVVFPTLIVVGLIVLPYIDVNPKGNGYYCFNERKFAIITYLFGFLILWVLLIVLGTFLRGPNWNFYGPYEVWDLHKLEALRNVNLSEYIFRVAGLNGGKLPDFWLWREFVGIVLVFAYVFAGPVLLGKTVMKGFLEKMGQPRFYVMVSILLMMASLPIKMILRWTINLKYIVAIPEYFFNI